MLCQLARQELVKLSVEDTISHKLRAAPVSVAQVASARSKKTVQATKWLPSPLPPSKSIGSTQIVRARTLRFLLIAELAILGKHANYTCTA